MRVFPPQSDLRDKLIGVILRSSPDHIADLTDTTSLIKTGLVDSLGLVEIATYIEREIGRPLDFSRVNPEEEWDTIAGILQFIDKQH